MNNNAKIILKNGKEQSVKRLHPWIFSGAILKTEGKPSTGDTVDVHAENGDFLAVGHYQIGSIAVRIFSFIEVETGYPFWFNKLRTAYEIRRQLGLTDSAKTTVYRLVNAEGDDMPGVVIDFYNGIAVMQIHSVGMYRLRDTFVTILKELYSSRLTAVFDKSEFSLPPKAELGAKNDLLYGNDLCTTVLENGCYFDIDVKEGQKTGFFIDQRENRRLLSSYCNDKDVLNVFCYTGGFSVYAAKGNARLVHSVDSSSPAIELTDKNIGKNLPHSAMHQSFCTDAFAFLKDIRNRYDIIILDPPAFAKHQDALTNALQAYKRMNQLALQQIRPGGILFTFSCSQVVSKENFRKSVFAAAANARRSVRILHQLTQPPDHPVSIFHPEGEYLKGLVLHVT